jgi:hypothetical protein
VNAPNPFDADPFDADPFSAARSVADAVLYEGYVLYPYRASSRKNQARFQWGVLTPRGFSEAEGSERWSTRTECVLEAGPDSLLSVRIRCLQAQRRRCEQRVDFDPRLEDATFEPVDYLEVDGVVHMAWDEAVDQVVDLPSLPLNAVEGLTHTRPFSLEAVAETELIRDNEDTIVGRFVRTRQPITGMASIHASRPDPDLPYVKITVTVENTTPWSGGSLHRDDAMVHSLIAVHTMLAVDDGRFVSLLDPPAEAVAVTAACQSEGAYPVLIGEGDGVVLSSPIILYDHPEVAPQSPGDLYDSLEIDEILALRVMTLTDEEKSEARGTDPRAAAIIDRCDDMSAETLSALHGQMRPVGASTLDVPTWTEPGSTALDSPWWDPVEDASFDPWTETVWVSGVAISKGTAVRLQPSHRADAHDMFLRGMPATVAGVFTDVDGDQHVAVTVDDDPATEALAWQGRYLFFHPDEVEPLVESRDTR